MKWTVDNVKTFRGRDGHGFNARLLRDGVPVAYVIDAADGGPFRFEWYGTDKVGVPGVGRVTTAHRDLLDECAGKTVTIGEFTLDMDPDLFVDQLVAERINR